MRIAAAVLVAAGRCRKPATLLVTLAAGVSAEGSVVVWLEIVPGGGRQQLGGGELWTDRVPEDLGGPAHIRQAVTGRVLGQDRREGEMRLSAAAAAAVVVVVIVVDAAAAALLGPDMAEAGRNLAVG
ncbi:hypothetical protein QBC41DRAFT_307001 [Cercophora samala]|uniref:Uncharacterized protein n=1 Tax=Cercophora samala TaxID=330535 RepID=A0AA40D717_9PEZI|nr:hypothetical protein QBC41DRAFT_307001 [Cercophora samala]